MKTAMWLSCLMVLFAAGSGLGQSRYPVEDRETIRQTLQFSGAGAHMVEVDNIEGSIRVVSHGGNDVEMVANRTIRAASADRVETAKQEVSLDITSETGVIRLYVNTPERCNCADGRDGWRSRGRNAGYRVSYDFELRVPRETALRLRTINDGDIVVENMAGNFELDNINGSIRMTDVSGSGSAHTINGPVTVTFEENPRSATSFKSLNGDIEVGFQPDLSADLRLKTFNGGIYTDFEVEPLPSPAPVPERVNGRFVYRSNEFMGVRVGDGGPEIKFDGFNGDVRVVRRTR